MANQITDNRTIVYQSNSVTGDNGGRWDTLGSTSETLDTDVKIEGTGSIGEQCTSSVRTLIWDAGATQDYSNNVFYFWINCGVVGLLSAKASAGFAIRFTGPSSADFFEFYVGGNDFWPQAIEGGWVQFVIDIEATPSNTGGTPPATTAIQGVGASFQTSSVMTKVSDNTWLDECRRLPDGSPGIVVEGRNAGTTDWNFADIRTQLGTSAGTLKDGPGGSYTLNAPIQFGINDTSTHGFSDTNQLILWENHEWAPTDLYKLSALGNAGGTTNVTMGIKTGTADAATGAQGITFRAAATGVRWDADFNDPNLDGINFYGCSFAHGGAFLLNDVSVSVISTQYLDCTSALVSNSEQLRNLIIDANTADGVAFMTTDDLSDIVYSSFEFSDGHAIELTTPRIATQASKGNLFTGYSTTGTNDAAVYNNTAGAVTINVTDGGGTPTYRNGTSASTTVVSAVTVTVNVVDEAGDPVATAQTSIYLSSDNSEVMNQDTDGSGIASTTYSGTTPVNVYWRVRKSSTGDTKYIAKSGPSTITSTGMEITVQIDEDSNA